MVVVGRLVVVVVVVVRVCAIFGSRDIPGAGGSKKD